MVVNRFLSADRIVTVSEKGLVVVWSLPDFKQVAAASLPDAKAWTLSPNRQYLAAIQGGAVRVLDLATGTVAGDLVPSFAPKPTPLSSFVAFRGDGREVVAGFQAAAGPVLVRWDAATGRVRHEAPFAGALSSNLRGYVGDGFVLLDFNAVYDLERGAVVWTLGGGSFAWFRSDDRVWYAVNGPGTGATLAAAKFPTPEVEGLIAEIADGPGGVLKPGTRVGLSLDVQGGMATTFRPKVAAAIKAGWQAREWELVTKGAEVEVAVAVSERDTGEKITFRNFGRPIGGGDSVPVLELEAKTTVTAGGEVLWAPEPTRSRTHGGFVRLADGEDLSEHLYKQMWAGVVGWGQTAAAPRYLAKTARGVQALPQFSLLTANGIEVKEPPQRKR